MMSTLNIIKQTCLGLLYVLTLAVIFQIQVGVAALAGTPFKIPCDPTRTEISFPVITDSSHSVSSLYSSPKTSDLMFLNLQWRKRKFQVILFKNQITSPQTNSEWREGNETVVKIEDETCFYHGYIRSQSSSYVAISTCEGVSGYIQTNEELLFIQPATVESSDSLQPHLLYTCEPKEQAHEPDWTAPSTAGHMRRQRRSTRNPKYLEVMVVVDHTVLKEIGTKERTTHYVMALMNIANTVYQHHTLGVDIKVVVTKIVFLEKRQQREVLTVRDAFATVNKFCEWSRKQIPAGQAMDYDISVLITKSELGPSGYAPITGLCNPIRSCAAVRDEGFTTGFIIAHEMAHVFGLFHDGHGNNCHGRKYQTSLMASLVESKLNHFWWSECSSRRMKEMIRYLFCLNNEPKRIENHYSLDGDETLDENMGKNWSLDFQCRMEFGPYFKLCGAFYNDPCGTLWCSHRQQGHLCRTKRGPPLPGSVCGRDRECRDNRCQYIGNHRPVNGHWSAWSAWTECSTNCGVGVKQRSRVCDNPAPAYDGKDCEGEADKWDTCVNNTCESYDDVRAGECDIWDSLQIRYGTNKWQPYEGQNASSLCKQTCKSSYTKEILTIDVNVADGTPCSYTGNNSNICLDGNCLTVGCDGKINSTKKTDWCGICDGDGSECKVVQGTFAKKPTGGDTYVPLLIIPAGARDIKIKETKQTSQFLALKDPRYGTFRLNGDLRQSGNIKMVINGAIFEYTRTSGDKNESITSTGPLRHPLEVNVYPNRVREKTAVSYSYVVHKSDFTMEKNRYKWKFEKWSTCSVTCGEGVQSIVHGCYDKDTDEKVEQEKCQFLKAPRKDEVKCRREPCGVTRYNYAMSNEFSDCNAECDEEGEEVQQFFCERIFINNGSFSKVADRFCSHLDTPHHAKVCHGKPCEKEESFRWSGSETWTDCPCGDSSSQTREIFCEKVITTVGKDVEPDVEVVDQENCQGLSDKPESERPCLKKPCPPTFNWAESGDYTPCKAECGESGVMEAKLVCEQVMVVDGMELIEMADDFFCDDIERPEVITLPCTGEPCQDEPAKFEWQPTDEWTECNAECGTQGKQVRLYKCQSLDEDDDGTVDADSKCENGSKPHEERDCEGLECPLKWTIGEWSECSVTCGSGRHYRKIHCGDPDTDLDDIRCTDTPPPMSKACTKAKCPVSAAKDCEDMYSFCTTYSALKYRCRRRNFQRKCCRTCLNSESSARRPMDALERYMMKRRLKRYRRR